MSAEKIGVLIVDDFAPARESMRNLLAAHSEIELLGEAGDGLQAIERSRCLQPDLIMLDINLPELDGIQVAKALRAGRSSVIFVSTDSDQDIIEAAFATGACGYVLKADMACDLWQAVEAYRQGAQYRSRSIRPH